ncbi:MAG: HNH endonuclease family protein, partial [Bryobacteraceae bacterium]
PFVHAFFSGLLELLRTECKLPTSPTQISQRLLDVAHKLTGLYGNSQLSAVTDILQARLLAVAILAAPNVDEEERKALLDQWERITFRIFGLFGKDSRTKVGDYVKLGYRIVTNHSEARSYSQIMTALRDLGSEYPADKAADEGLAGKNFYESADACRYLLWNYEEHLARKLGFAATYDEQERAAIWRERASDSIEHIFPQSADSEPGWAGKMRDVDGKEHPVEHNVGRVGNLILLPGPLNSQAKIRPFDEKKTVYAKHNLRMVVEVRSEPEWTLTSIIQREARIVEWAKQRWADLSG